MTGPEASSQGQPPARPALLDGTDLVILDFDGVVVDSEPISLETLRTTLDAFGLSMTPDDVRRAFLGKSISAVNARLKDAGLAHKTDSFAQTWQAELFAQFRKALRPIPGVTDLLDLLDRHAIGYCIASSGSPARIDVALEAVGLRARFPHIFSAAQVARGKPAPDLFLLAAEQLDVPPARCLVFEDAPFGVMAARAADMRCVAFVGGTHLSGIRDRHAAELLGLGAERAIDSYAHVLPGDQRGA